MKIGIPAETRAGETRVAATPETVRQLTLKHQVIVQSGAGLPASIADEAYAAAGAAIGSAAEAFGCQVVLKVRAPDAAERKLMQPGTVLLGTVDRFSERSLAALAAAGLQAYSLNAVPRLTPAQSIDVLSSYSNIATYKAVMMAAHLPVLNADLEERDMPRQGLMRGDHRRYIGRKTAAASRHAA